MRRPINTLVTARWPWLAMSALVCVAAAGFILLLQTREHEARHNAAVAREFSTGLPIGNSMNDSGALPMFIELANQRPKLLDSMLRRQLVQLQGQLGPIQRIDPTGATQIRAALDRAEAQPKGQIVASAREFAKAAQIASRVATQQSARADRTERDSFIGSIGALAFATLLVAILLSRERRLTLRAARLHAAEMQRLADHDGLTSLLNRRCFDEALQALSETDDGAIEIVVCDVNGLKSINDRFGHHAGDAVLVTATHDLQRAVGTGGTVYRTGGDEFSVISRPGVRIADLARGAFERDGTIIASVGAAAFPTDSPLAREVVRLADNRMYDAKRAIDPTAVARQTV